MKRNIIVCFSFWVALCLCLTGCTWFTQTTEQENSNTAAAKQNRELEQEEPAVETGGLEEEIPQKTESEDSTKYIAITFDDGPTGNKDGLTERLLDGLKERNAHATFFLCGYRIKEYNSMMERYLEEGHEIGSHTMDHVNLTSEVDDGGYEQILSNNELIESYVGRKPTVMRPTGGAYDEAVEQSMTELDMPIIIWDVDTEDWKNRDEEAICQRIIQQARDGSIVLEHDLYEETLTGVLEAIDELKEQGYEFVTVSELAEKKGVRLCGGQVYYDFVRESETK